MVQGRLGDPVASEYQVRHIYDNKYWITPSAAGTNWWRLVFDWAAAVPGCCWYDLCRGDAGWLVSRVTIQVY